MKSGAKPSRMTHAGCHVQACVWIKLGLSQSQAKRLRAVAAQMIVDTKDRTSARAAWYLLNAALEHLPELYALMAKDAKGERGPWALKHVWERSARAILKQLN
jgi:hypothetical protein